MENVGIYETIIDAASKYAPEPELRRIDEIRKILDQVHHLGDGISDPLDFSRAAYAAFILSGASLMRICGEVPGSPRTARGDTLLNWRRFETSPETHRALVEELLPLLPATMQVAVTTMIGALLAGKMGPLQEAIRGLMVQVGRHDAAGGSQMVDLAVSCLLPPIVRGIDHPSAIYMRHTEEREQC